jgi:hypothetical protein
VRRVGRRVERGGHRRRGKVGLGVVVRSSRVDRERVGLVSARSDPTRAFVTHRGVDLAVVRVHEHQSEAVTAVSVAPQLWHKKIGSKSTTVRGYTDAPHRDDDRNITPFTHPVGMSASRSTSISPPKFL